MKRFAETGMALPCFTGLVILLTLAAAERERNEGAAPTPTPVRAEAPTPYFDTDPLEEAIESRVLEPIRRAEFRLSRMSRVYRPERDARYEYRLAPIEDADQKWIAFEVVRYRESIRLEAGEEPVRLSEELAARGRISRDATTIELTRGAGKDLPFRPLEDALSVLAPR